MAARKLSAYVHVDGQVYGPGDEVPTEVAKRISNPDAWADDSAEPEPVADEKVDEEAEEKPAPRRHARSLKPKE